MSLGFEWGWIHLISQEELTMIKVGQPIQSIKNYKNYKNYKK